jgi:hypothetical protein
VIRSIEGEVICVAKNRIFLAFVLGLIHGAIDLHQQLFLVGAVVAVDADADARCHEYGLFPFDWIGCFENSLHCSQRVAVGNWQCHHSNGRPGLTA